MMKKRKFETSSNRIFLYILFCIVVISACNEKSSNVEIPKLWTNGMYIDSEFGISLWGELSSKGEVSAESVIKSICDKKGSFDDGDGQLTLAELLLGLNDDPARAIDKLLKSDDIENIAAGLLVSGYLGDIRFKKSIRTHLSDSRKMPIGYRWRTLGEIADRASSFLEVGGIPSEEGKNLSEFGNWVHESQISTGQP